MTEREQERSVAGRRSMSPLTIEPQALLELGYIGKSHGLNGEMRLVLHNSHSEAPDTVEHLVLKRDELCAEYDVESIRGSSKAYLVRLSGVDTREAADACKGATVYARRSELPPLDADEYYLSDLLGARVEGPEGVIGEVVDVAIHPTVDCIIIHDQSGRRLEQPLLEPWLESVNIAERLVRLRSLDGLIE